MKITDKVHKIKIPFSIPVAEGRELERFVNVYLITGKSLYLIDTGTSNAIPVITEYIKSINRDLQELKTIYLTHAHPDHIGALSLLKNKCNCGIYVHNEEKNWVEDIDRQYKERPVPGFYQLVSGSSRVDFLYDNNKEINPEHGITLQVVHTPGHSDGSVSLLYKEENILFSGDAVILPGEMPIYTDVKKYIKSINKITALDVQILLSSWDEPRYGTLVIEILDLSRSYIRKIHDTVVNIYSEDRSVSPGILCKRVLKKLGIPEFLVNPLLENSVLAHIKYTEKDNSVL